MLKVVGIVLAVVALIAVWQFVHLIVVLIWGDMQTQRLNYYGKSLAQRRRFKRLLHWNAVLLSPILWVLGKLSRFRFEKASFLHGDVSAPRGICTPETFAAAANYQPQQNDVFIVTQMKCGTTWMQHVVYQILTRGEGDLVAEDRTLYAVSPWIESIRSVGIEQAPLIGAERASRIIKTHLPASLCPFDSRAKYIYVTRDPVSCFASCVDFERTNLGDFSPPLDEFQRWFTGNNLMWWGTWPAHVAEWLRRAAEAPNVLHVRFEDMKTDFAAVVARVTDFLQIAPLTPDEMSRVSEKCGFDYMQTHHETFEMNPPHLLQDGTGLFVSGAVDRHKGVPDEVRRDIAAWVASELRETDFPLERLYPQ